jgi:NTP pyrophosphatase (non-canonical NTP hydrolase)
VDLDQYELFVDDRCRPFVDFNYTVVAINEEAGEIAGWYKKAVLRKQEKYTKQMLLEEMGDVLFYLVKMARLNGWDMEHVMQANVDKLMKRGDKIG